MLTKVFRSSLLLVSVTTLSGGIFFSSGPAVAQDYGAMLQEALQQNNLLTQQMQQTESQIVQQNMANPQIQQQYQDYRSSGGMMSFEQYAYGYAATGGYSEEGKQIYYQNERDIQRRDAANQQGYLDHQRNLGQQIAEDRQRSADWRSRHTGNLLSGTSDYVDPRTGTVQNLPNTVQPNTVLQDPHGYGQPYYVDPTGSYYQRDNSGYWNELQEVE